MRVRSAAALVLLGGSLAGLACSTFGSNGPSDEPVDAGGLDAPPGDDAASDAGGDASDATTPCVGVATTSDAGEDAACGANGALVELSASASNCGFCGHACNGGPDLCRAGLCNTSTLVAQAKTVLGGQNANEIFFGHYDTAPSEVKATSHDGTSVRLVANTAAAVAGLALMGDVLWVDTYDGIYTVSTALSPDAGTLSPVVQAANVFHRLALNSTDAYFANTQNGDLMRAPIAGGLGSATITVQGRGADTIAEIYADDTALIWLDRTADCTSKILVRYANDPGNVVPRHEGGCIRSFAVDAESIWVGEDYTISKMPRLGADPPVVVATWTADDDKKHPLGILPAGDRLLVLAGDDSNGIYTDQNPVLYEVPTCGGRVHRITHDLFLANTLLLDGPWVLAGTFDGITRIAK